MGRRQWLELPPDLNPPTVRLIRLIRALKDDHDLTLNELAAKTHYARSSWERWLNGKRLVTASAIESLVRATGADGTVLLELHAQALAAEQGAAPNAEQAAAARATPTRPTPTPSPKAPRQLPVDTRVFTGRGAELAALLDVAGQAGAGTEAGMVVISSINGMGGIGKTALAVRAAHRLADEFHDGQLFIDLRGYSADHEPIGADEALDHLLRSLGVPAQAIPRDLGGRAALYRSTLADTRTLIVLDNASSTAQVRPLLPGSPGCLVLITSRNVLMGLDDTHVVALDVLPEDEAAALLRKVAGADRVDPGDPAVAELVALCGYVPLAIRIVAARLRHHRFLTVAGIAAELREEAERLARLSDGERDLTSVFESSYRDLPELERAVFRRLGLVPGPDFDVHGIANLTGAAFRDTERMLESLLDHNLLIQHTAGRYRLHDLLRAYARSLPQVPGEDAAAVERLADYYQGVAHTAHLLLTNWTRSPSPRPAPAPEIAPAIHDRETARAAMRAEAENILAMITAAVGRGEAARAVALTAEIGVFFNQEGRWPLAAKLLRESVELAAGLGDRHAEAGAFWNLGSIQRLSGELPEAITSQERAIALYREIGDRQGQANALSFLGMANAASGHMQPSVDALNEALSIYTEVGDRRGATNMLQQLCGVTHMMGDSRTARELNERAMVGSRELGDRNGQAVLLGTLGRIQFSDGEFENAARSFEECMELFRALGNRQNEAQALNELARTRLALGEPAASADACTQALELSRELGFASGVSAALLGIGRARFALGDLDGATETLEQSLAAEEERGALIGQSNTALVLGRVWHAAGEHARARAYFERALEARRGSSARGGESEVHSHMAALLVDTEGPARALPRYLQALEIAREVNRPADIARALEGVGRCRVAIGEGEPGLEALREAVGIYRRLGVAEAGPAAEYLASLNP